HQSTVSVHDEDRREAQVRSVRIRPANSPERRSDRLTTKAACSLLSLSHEANTRSIAQSYLTPYHRLDIRQILNLATWPTMIHLHADIPAAYPGTMVEC